MKTTYFKMLFILSIVFFLLISEKTQCVDPVECYNNILFCGPWLTELTDSVNLPNTDCYIKVYYQQRICPDPLEGCNDSIHELFIYRIDLPDNNNCKEWHDCVFKDYYPYIDSVCWDDLYQTAYISLIHLLFLRDPSNPNYYCNDSCKLPGCGAGYAYFIPRCMGLCYGRYSKDVEILLVQGCPDNPNPPCCQFVRRCCFCRNPYPGHIVESVYIVYTEDTCYTSQTPTCPADFKAYPGCIKMCYE